MAKRSLLLQGQEVFYDEFGKGKTLLMVHGFGIHSVIWDDMLPELSKHFRILTLDLIGYGHNSDILFSNTIADQAHYIHHFINEVKDVDFVLGYSYGARVVHKYCFNVNKPVKKVIIVTPPFLNSPLFTLGSYLCSILSKTYISAQILRSIVSSWPLKMHIISTYGLIEPINKQVIDRCVEIFRKQRNVKAMLQGVADLFRPYDKTALTSIKPDYIFTEHDLIAKPDTPKFLPTILNANSVTNLKGAFHLLPFEKPQELTDVLVHLLK